MPFNEISIHVQNYCCLSVPPDVIKKHDGRVQAHTILPSIQCSKIPQGHILQLVLLFCYEAVKRSPFSCKFKHHKKESCSE